jgi:hypothetical protein
VPVDDLVYPGKGDMDALGELRLGHAEGLEELLKEHLSGVRRWPVFGKHRF